jgi:hypothetical protein
MTTEELARLAAVEDAIGMHWATHHPSPDDLIPENTLPSGRYPLILADYQIRLSGIPPLESKIAALEARCADLERVNEVQATRIVELQEQVGNVPAPSVNVLPLVAAEGTAVRETRDLKKLREDGWVKTFDANALRLDAEQHHGHHAFLGKVAIGGQPLDLDAGLQVNGGGEVLFYSRVPEAKTQEKNGDRTRLGVVSFNPYDNGVRFIRGGAWKNGVMHHNPDDPVVHILAMDSSGWVSKSREDYSKDTAEKCQDYIIKEDDERKEYVFVVCRAGWGARIAASTRTTNMNNPDNFNRSAQLIAPLPGAV